MSNRDEAKRLLVYYLELLASRSISGLGTGNRVEIAAIVDFIVDAALEEMAQRGEPRD